MSKRADMTSRMQSNAAPRTTTGKHKHCTNTDPAQFCARRRKWAHSCTHAQVHMGHRLSGESLYTAIIAAVTAMNDSHGLKDSIELGECNDSDAHCTGTYMPVCMHAHSKHNTLQTPTYKRQHQRLGCRICESFTQFSLPAENMFWKYLIPPQKGRGCDFGSDVRVWVAGPPSPCMGSPLVRLSGWPDLVEYFRGLLADLQVVFGGGGVDPQRRF